MPAAIDQVLDTSVGLEGTVVVGGRFGYDLYNASGLVIDRAGYVDQSGSAGFALVRTDAGDYWRGFFPVNQSDFVSVTATAVGAPPAFPDLNPFVAGTFKGEVAEDDGPVGLTSESGSVDAFVTLWDDWATWLTGPGTIRIHDMAIAGPEVSFVTANYLQMLPMVDENGTRPVSPQDGAGVLVIAGSYQSDGTAADALTIYGGELDLEAPESLGGFDGFVALLNAETRGPAEMLRIGGSDDDEILGVAINFYEDSTLDEPSPEIYITGYFSGTVDFDPTSGTENRSSINGSKDIFVAKYILGATVPFTLDWVYTTGTSDNDEARAIAIDNFGTAYVTGGKHVDGTNDALYVAAIYGLGGNGANLWEHDIQSGYRIIGNGITLDRETSAANVYVTGLFRVQADFDPFGEDVRYTTGTGYNFDVFVTRYFSSGAYLGTETFGGAYNGAGYNDVGTCIAADPVRRLVHHGGYYGGGAPSGYQVNFDPDDSQDGVATGRQNSDGFWNTLGATIPEVDVAISLVLDASTSMNTPNDCDQVYAIMDSLADIIEDPDLDIW